MIGRDERERSRKVGSQEGEKERGTILELQVNGHGLQQSSTVASLGPGDP